MKLDDIQDIEVLRNELKKHMVKCIKPFVTTKNREEITFKAGEYYYIVQDDDHSFFIHDSSDDSDLSAFVDRKILNSYFECN